MSPSRMSATRLRSCFRIWRPASPAKSCMWTAVSRTPCRAWNEDTFPLARRRASVRTVATPTMTIGILAALREEAAQLLDEFEAGGRRTRVALRDYTVGTIHGQDCVMVLARVGKVAAATTATALIERFGVDRLIF